MARCRFVKADEQFIGHLEGHRVEAPGIIHAEDRHVTTGFDENKRIGQFSAPFDARRMAD